MFPIGLFDSGVGGLSVLRHVQTQLPHEALVYVADQAHVPYGQRPLMEIRAFSEAITRALLAYGCKLIVVACNTASGAALTHLRQTFPAVPFVGMEPAVKPAAQLTRSGKVGVLATAGTFESQRYLSLMARFATGISVLENPCHGLVDLIEAGASDSPATADLLRQCVRPMLAAGVDTLVLGCTHYPFVQPLLAQIVATETTTAVSIIDPAPAVARQVEHRLHKLNLLAETAVSSTVPGAEPGTIVYTPGDAPRVQALAHTLLGQELVTKTAVWRGDTLHLPE